MPLSSSRSFRAVAVGGLLSALLAAPALAQSGLYVRGGLSAEWSRDTRFVDQDCGATRPPALFGCGFGSNGQPLSAKGDFGFPIAIEGGLGYRLAPMFRGEALIGYRGGSTFEGNANFLATPNPQPVTGEVDSLTAMAVAYLDFPGFGLSMLVAPIEPFVGIGVGGSYHTVSRMTYAFPGLGPTASTVVGGGSSVSLSYMVTAGAAVRLSPHLTLDVAYRYTDLGTVETDEAPALITRPAFTTALTIAGTEADFATHGLSASIRFGF